MTKQHKISPTAVVHALKCAHLKQVLSLTQQNMSFMLVSAQKVSHRRLEFSDKFYLHLPGTFSISPRL
jgi:tRNA1(Val) A37 N6-methylase TrmN6